MEFIAINVGVIGTNCYIAYCEDTLEAAVIDPGGDASKILNKIKQHNLKVKYIINTHGHFDHIVANRDIKQAFGAEILIHQADADMLDSGPQNLSVYFGSGIECGPADMLLQDGEIISFGNVALTVLHTPGHTPGGICLKTGDTVFAGDTLFAQGIGRTDFPGGSEKQLIASIRSKLLILDDNTKILPGHGSETTIGWEKKMNPFINMS